MTRVVIVGGGFAGTAVARALERVAPRESLDVLLIDRHNYMLFTPMLPEVAAGSIEPRHIVAPFRSTLPKTRFELGEVLGANAATGLRVRHPLTGHDRSVPYDHLVLALGSTWSTMGVEGVREHALPLKSLADAQSLRNRVIETLEVAARTTDVVERDRLLRFAVMGGGFTGVEAIGELSGFLRRVKRFYPVAQQAQLVLVQGKDRLLPHLPERFGFYAARSLRERGVDIRTNEEVQSVEADALRLKSGERVASRTVIWSAGAEPAPVTKALGVPTTSHGAVKANADFSVDGHPGLWALGDCAAVPKPGGGEYAQLAQIAVREGPQLARNIVASLHGRPTRNFRYRKAGQMASLGDHRALAQLRGNHMVAGRAAWALWRAYYLARLPKMSKRVRVALDWTLAAVFPPDLAWLPGPSTLEEELEHAASR